MDIRSCTHISQLLSQKATSTAAKRAALNRSRAIRKMGLLGVTGGCLGFGGYVLYKHRKGEQVDLGPLEPVHAEITKQWNSMFGSVLPTSETLLPDRQRGIPEGVPVLVLDMEQTIMQRLSDQMKEWGFEGDDWEHAKRTYEVNGAPAPDVQIIIESEAKNKMNYLQK